MLPGVHARRIETIEVITIDQLPESLALTRVDFIKMDIEGAETHALVGAQRSLRKCDTAAGHFRVPRPRRPRTDYLAGTQGAARVSGGFDPADGDRSRGGAEGSLCY
jgi:hypothetical protein